MSSEQPKWRRDLDKYLALIRELEKSSRFAKETEKLLAEWERIMANAPAIPPVPKDIAIGIPAGHLAISDHVFAALVDTEALLPAFEKYRAAVNTAPEQTDHFALLKQLALDTYEVVADREWRTDTWSARFKTLLQIVLFAYTFVETWQQGQTLTDIQDKVTRGLNSISSIQTTVNKQTVAINAVADALREIKQQQEQILQMLLPQPSLQVTNTAILREGPYGQSGRVARLQPGVLLVEIVRLERWFYVETIDESGTRTGVRGWIYRRSVRRVE